MMGEFEPGLGARCFCGSPTFVRPCRPGGEPALRPPRSPAAEGLGPDDAVSCRTNSRHVPQSA